jgi:hypothetical protein
VGKKPGLSALSKLSFSQDFYLFKQYTKCKGLKGQSPENVHGNRIYRRPRVKPWRNNSMGPAMGVDCGRSLQGSSFCCREYCR